MTGKEQRKRKENKSKETENGTSAITLIVDSRPGEKRREGEEMFFQNLHEFIARACVCVCVCWIETGEPRLDHTAGDSMSIPQSRASSIGLGDLEEWFYTAPCRG